MAVITLEERLMFPITKQGRMLEGKMELGQIVAWPSQLLEDRMLTVTLHWKEVDLRDIIQTIELQQYRADRIVLMLLHNGLQERSQHLQDQHQHILHQRGQRVHGAVARHLQEVVVAVVAAAQDLPGRVEDSL